MPNATGKEPRNDREQDSLSVVLGAVLLLGCNEAPPTSFDEVETPLVLQDNKTLDLDLCSPAGNFTLVSTNSYWPMDVGDFWILEGEDDDVPVRLEVEVTRRTERVAGVRTRVMTETEFEDGELLEVSWNFFAQVEDDDVLLRRGSRHLRRW
jgi:predicted glutamine amidotransferase